MRALLWQSGHPGGVADLVWFLAGEGRAGYVTGETLTATGGSIPVSAPATTRHGVGSTGC